ncbi:hypothetical protein ACV229_15445 [Burkholderia sp. MR1-5-21]
MRNSIVRIRSLRAGGLIGATLTAASLFLFIASADAAGPEKASGTKPDVHKIAVPPQLAITATFQEIMDAEMDPASEKVWKAVGVTNDATGTHQKAPSTPAEWQELRRQSIRLAEAANLIMLPGRHVAAGSTTIKSMEPLDVAAIQKRLAANPVVLAAFAESFRGVALQLVDAVDKRDAAAFSKAGEALDGVCEGCHKTFWYPDENKISRRLQGDAPFGDSSRQWQDRLRAVERPDLAPLIASDYDTRRILQMLAGGVRPGA